MRVEERNGKLIELGKRGVVSPVEVKRSLPKDWLRPLPMAITCKHLDPHRLKNDEAVALSETARKLNVSCRSCSQTTMLQKCMGGGGFDGYTTSVNCCTCPLWESKEAQPERILSTPSRFTPLTAKRVIHFDRHNLEKESGGDRLNPSIIDHEDGYVFAYRNSWGNANVSIIRLNKDFQPIGRAKQLNLSHSLASNGREDPRLFRHKGKLHLSYILWNGYRRTKEWRKASVGFARLNNDTLEVEDKFCPDIPGRNSWEKNHSYFDYQGETHCVYSSRPHKVLKVLCNSVTDAYETSAELNWGYGEIRGGASPVLVGSEYWHFFHGMLERNRGRLYTLGLICFEAAPPFRITRYTPIPLDIANNPSRNIDVIFPGGAVKVGNEWCIAMGVDDDHCELRFYEASEVEACLRSV